MKKPQPEIGLVAALSSERRKCTSMTQTDCYIALGKHSSYSYTNNIPMYTLAGRDTQSLEQREQLRGANGTMRQNNRRTNERQSKVFSLCSCSAKHRIAEPECSIPFLSFPRRTRQQLHARSSISQPSQPHAAQTPSLTTHLLSTSFDPTRSATMPKVSLIASLDVFGNLPSH